MKVKTVIKVDFYANPQYYGYYLDDDLRAIWREKIKPSIQEIDSSPCGTIHNLCINEWILRYRETFRELNW